MCKKLLFLLFIVFMQGNASAANLGGLNYLKNVEAFSNADEMRIVVDFKKPLQEYSQSVLYKKSFQIDLPKSYINPSKRLFSIDDALVSHIYAVQHSPDRVRLRFVFGQHRIDDMHDLSIKKDSNKMIISIKRNSVVIVNNDDIGDINGAITDTQDKVADVDSAPFPDLGDLLRDSGEHSKNSEEKVLNIASAVPDIYSTSIKMFSSLFIMLSLIFVGAYLFRKYISKGKKGFGAGKPIQVLSTCYVGTKKTIALVHIANEVLVLGISNNHISLLTKLEDNDTVERLKEGKAGRSDKVRRSSSFEGFLDENAAAVQSSEPVVEDREESINRLTGMIRKMEVSL